MSSIQEKKRALVMLGMQCQADRSAAWLRIREVKREMEARTVMEKTVDDLVFKYLQNMSCAAGLEIQHRLVTSGICDLHKSNGPFHDLPLVWSRP